VTKNRFALPLDHRATRPGFQAPWGSGDPAQEVRQSSVFMGVVGGILVSWGLFAFTRRDNGTAINQLLVVLRRLSHFLLGI
jgi:hypothetical protein